MKTHRRYRKETASWNPQLAEFLAEGIPEYQEIAVVPAEERFTAEAAAIKSLGSRHRLLNRYHNGYRHPAEVRAKISRSLRARYRASRAGLAATVP